MEHTAEPTFAQDVAASARRLGKGDLTEWNRFYDLVAARTLRYACLLTHRQADAEDVLQLVLTRVAENPLLLAAATYPWAYYLQIVRNESIRWLSRQRKTMVLESSQGPIHFDTPPLLQQERDRQIRVAIDRLPPEQAEVVLLKLWEGMTFQEIATLTGETINTVASRYRYALAKLSQMLKPLAQEEAYRADS